MYVYVIFWMIWGFPTNGDTPKWIVYKGKSYLYG